MEAFIKDRLIINIYPYPC
uniref:Uncharacterized protein n=1 Tax=Arundo donax TaxID=35708 RepID=A0A0A8YTL1_ARUDO